jgi:hypothetical protein
LNTNKKNKLENLSENCETNLMILINVSLAHMGTVAREAFYRLIRLKKFVSRFFPRTVQLAFFRLHLVLHACVQTCPFTVEGKKN